MRFLIRANAFSNRCASESSRPPSFTVTREYVSLHVSGCDDRSNEPSVSHRTSTRPHHFERAYVERRLYFFCIFNRTNNTAIRRRARKGIFRVKRRVEGDREFGADRIRKRFPVVGYRYFSLPGLRSGESDTFLGYVRSQVAGIIAAEVEKSKNPRDENGEDNNYRTV